MFHVMFEPMIHSRHRSFVLAVASAEALRTKLYRNGWPEEEVKKVYVEDKSKGKKR